MGKDLSKMTLEELWVLFPIFLVAHDERWEAYYKEIEQELSGLLADQTVIRISHIGSTAIQGIWAKNIVDVMVEIPQSVEMKAMAQILEQSGFTIMSFGANRVSLNKGYTENGFADKVYHIQPGRLYRCKDRFHLQMDGRSKKGMWRQILTNCSL